MVKHELKVKIHEESDLFSPFDPDQNVISEDVVDYFARTLIHKHRRMKEEYLLNIISDTPVNEENVKQKLKYYFIQEKENLEYALRRMTLKAITLGLIGIFFLALYMFTSGNESINTEILCIIGWVGVWEATDICIMERTEMLQTRYHIKK